MASKPLDYRGRLTRLRDLLTAASEAAEPRELPAIAGRLSDVLAVLESLPAGEASAVDDLAAKRSRRRAVMADAPAESVERGAGSGGAGGKRGSAS